MRRFIEYKIIAMAQTKPTDEGVPPEIEALMHDSLGRQLQNDDDCIFQ